MLDKRGSMADTYAVIQIIISFTRRGGALPEKANFGDNSLSSVLRLASIFRPGGRQRRSPLPGLRRPLDGGKFETIGDVRCFFLSPAVR